MRYALHLLIAFMMVVSAAMSLYILWCAFVRPKLPWERQAQMLAEWMRDVFGQRAKEEVEERMSRAAVDGSGSEWRQWRRVGRYLEGRR